MRLCEALLEYEKENRYPCHMPGHKGNSKGSFLGDILRYDITETDGMDNLHDADGVIYESEKFASKLYGSKETHFLINGSTVGIISAILGTLEAGQKILIARNCHRSVYNSIEAGRLLCRYLYPSFIRDFGINGQIEPDELKSVLEKDSDIIAVVITSPTYEGIVSDVSKLSKICHENGALLIVDSAHGAHFGFFRGFPESHVRQGADIVIHSVHKTLPAPTQTALLHICTDLVDKEKVRKQLRIYQSSSPSYLLMAGIDDCMTRIDRDREALFSSYLDNLEDLNIEASGLKNLQVTDSRYLKDNLNIYDADPCKIMISSVNGEVSGKELYDILLREYGIQAEMASDRYCLFILSVMDGKDGFNRIKNALKCIDEKFSAGKIHADKEKCRETAKNEIYDLRLKQILPISKAASCKGKKVNLADAVGSVSCTYVSIYPPGIPILVPGEEITREFIEVILENIEKGLNVQGISKDRMIRVYE